MFDEKPLLMHSLRYLLTDLLYTHSHYKTHKFFEELQDRVNLQLESLQIDLVGEIIRPWLFLISLAGVL